MIELLADMSTKMNEIHTGVKALLDRLDRVEQKLRAVSGPQKGKHE